MNSRQRRIKRMKSRLTAEEKKALELLRVCDNVYFYKHDCTISQAREVTSINGETELHSADNDKFWFKSDEGKIRVSAFIKNGAQNV